MNPSILIVLGLVLGLSVGLVVSNIDRFDGLEDNSWAAFIGTLIGASMTVAAAFAVTLYQSYVRNSERKEELRRKQLGARAILASDLSEIINYVERSAHAAMRGEEQNRLGVTHHMMRVQCPELNSDVLLRLQRLAELLTGDDADQVVDMIHLHQVQHARLESVITSLNNPELRNPPGLMLTENNFHTTLHATIELKLRANAMFPFARRETDNITQPPFPADDVESAFRMLGVEMWLPDYEKEIIVRLMGNMTPGGRWRES